MLIKLDMTVLEHDLIQSQVVMLLENKLMVYLLNEGIGDVYLMSSEKRKECVAFMDHSGTFPNTMPIADRGHVITGEEPWDVVRVPAGHQG